MGGVRGANSKATTSASYVSDRLLMNPSWSAKNAAAWGPRGPGGRGLRWVTSWFLLVTRCGTAPSLLFFHRTTNDITPRSARAMAVWKLRTVLRLALMVAIVRAIS